MENFSRKKFAILNLLLGQNVEQLPKYETKNGLQTKSTSSLSNVESIIASIPTAVGPKI